MSRCLPRLLLRGDIIATKIWIRIVDIKTVRTEPRERTERKNVGVVPENERKEDVAGNAPKNVVEDVKSRV